MADWHPPLSTDVEESARLYLDGLDRYLSVANGSGPALHEASRLDPGFGAAAAALALAAAAAGRPDRAREALVVARTAAATAPAMARSHIRAIEALVTLPTPRSLAIAGEHLAAHPADALVLTTTVQALHHSGRARHRQEALDLLDAALAAGTDHFVVPSLRSFLGAELGQLDRARADAEAALASKPRSAHAAHGLAHVFYETSDHEGGREWLTGWVATFDPRGVGLHLTWHLALHDLGLGDTESALARFTNSLGARASDRVYVDAVDLLWRLRLAGVDLEGRFADLRRVVPGVASVRQSTLAVAQSMVVLAGDGDEAGLEAAVHLLGRRRTDALYSRVLVPLARGLLAIVREDLDHAVTSLESIGAELVGLAASNAQLDVVSETLRWCYDRLGRQAPRSVFLMARLAPVSAARSTGAEPDASRGRRRLRRIRSLRAA
jgi:tetratricopeptide (TPR) repeat protein